jgi:tetratricopeptide (TPR) repeat protein
MSSSGNLTHAEIERLKKLNQVVADLQKKGRYADCLAPARELRDLARAYFGTNSQDYAITCKTVGMLYKRLGQFDAGEPYICEAVEIYSAVLTPRDRGLLQAKNLLSEFYRESGQYQKADVLWESLLRDASETFGPNSLDYSTFLNNRGLIDLQIGKLDLAAQKLEEALHIRQSLDPRSLMTAQSLFHLGECEFAQHHLSRAEDLFWQSIDLHREHKHPIERIVLSRMFRLYEAKDGHDDPIGRVSKAYSTRFGALPEPLRGERM